MLRPEVVMARRPRRTSSYPEVLLWQRLRGNPGGMRFRRQHPVGDYVADCYCARARVVIEVDGQSHDAVPRLRHDDRRNHFMQENGYRVIRIAARDVLRDVKAVAASIVASVARPLHHQPAAGGPPPRARED